MKNSLSDVNNYLFEQLERLNDDENLENEEVFKKEIQRSKAISSICTAIVSNAKVVLDAKKYCDEYGVSESEVLKLKEK